MNYYDILGIKKTATQEEIKTAYKHLVKKYHPDIYKGDKTFAEKKTAEINVAYETLSNEQLRKEYDDEITPKTNYYSTYESYHRPYHHSATQNSNYKYYNDQFSERIIKNVENLSSINKKRIAVIGIIVYLCILLYCILELHNFIIANNLRKPDIQTNTSYTQAENNKQDTTKTETSLPNNNILENSSIDTTPKNNPYSTAEDIDIYNYFTEEELKQFYSDLNVSEKYKLTYEEFLDVIKEYIFLLHGGH